MTNLPAYNKTLAAVVIGVLGWAGVVVTSDAVHITASEWLSLGTTLATALGVYSIANEPG